MKRLLTAAIGTPIVLLAVFELPAVWFFLFMAAGIELAVFEYVSIVRARVPDAPLKPLLLLVPLVAAAISFAPLEGSGGLEPRLYLLAAGAAMSVGLGTLVLFSRLPLADALPTLGALGFGVPYFALPVASLHLLRQARLPGDLPGGPGIDGPWLVLLLLAIVWLGDTAAFYVGSRLGRHRMAPVISPKKTWEGAAAGLATGVAAAAVWSVWKLGRLDLALLALAAVTGVAAQVGDLVESMIKRGAGVKDSGRMLPGHGGMLDRVDALLFAAPVLLLGVWILRMDAWSR